MEDEEKDLLKHTDTGGESTSEHEGERSHYTANTDRSRRIDTRKIPLGMWLLEATGLLNFKPLLRYHIGGL